jgi:hypothetical protein
MDGLPVSTPVVLNKDTLYANRLYPAICYLVACGSKAVAIIVNKTLSEEVPTGFKVFGLERSAVRKMEITRSRNMPW